MLHTFDSGDRLSGSVAHAAAFFAREAIAAQELDIEVVVVAFGAPAAFDLTAADYVAENFRSVE